MADRVLRVLTHIPESLLTRIGQEYPEVRVQPIPQEGELAAGVEGEVLLTQPWASPNLAQILERGVRWVHAYGTGVDAFPLDTLGDLPLTCSRGQSAIPISEWVLSVMLAAEKRLPASWIERPPQRWNFANLGSLHGKTLGLIGIGGIAQAVALRALPFGMRVLAYRRRDAPSPLPDVEIVRDLGQLLAAADHLVIAAPATRDTRHLIGRESLAQVKPGCHLVNVARGELVDQQALREALEDGRVALASLDCVAPEPLPEGHWLYTHPKVRLSPHISWCGPDALELLLDPFLENLGRYLAGQPLADRVDVKLGY